MNERVRRSLRVGRRVVEAVLAHAADASPSECCGLLIGTADVIAGAWRARNLEASRTAYLIDPADHFAAIRAARGLGMEVIGAYHSHQAADPLPSERDVAEALRGFVYLIASAGSQEPVRAFSLGPDRMEAIELVPDEHSNGGGVETDLSEPRRQAEDSHRCRGG